MSGIDVVFEVLPEEKPGDRSAPQVWEELQRQLEDPNSVLRSGEFGRYASQATLSGGGGFSSDAGEMRPGSGRGSVAFPVAEPVELSFPSDGFGPSAVGGPYAPAPQGGVWGAQGPYDIAADTQSRNFNGGSSDRNSPAAGMSNAELMTKISSLEQQLHQSPPPGPEPREVVRQEPPASSIRPRGPGGQMEIDVLQDKCTHYERRLETVERELREAQEASRVYRTKADQLEIKLKDREQLLVHAKEMWMKENVRASKLADSLTAAEDKLADQEKRLSEVSERYNEAQQEMRQLQHLLSKTGDYGGGGYANAAIHSPVSPKSQRPTSALDAFNSSSSAQLQSAVDKSFGGDFLGGENGRAMPSSSRGLGFQASADLAGGPSLPLPPLECETNSDRFRRLCLLHDAVLYEDELLQIGVKMEFVGREGQIGVYFGNKGTAALQAFTVQYFVREEQCLRLTASPLCQQIDADKQVVQRVNANFIEPFVEPVWLRVQFLLPDTSPRRVQLKFPLVITKFMIGRELSAQEFFHHWRQQHFVLNEVTNIVHLASRLRGQLVHVARSIVFGGALRLHHSIDTNPDNFVLVSQLAPAAPGQASAPRTSPDRTGRGLDVLGMDEDRETGLSLIRVEVGSGRFTGKARVVVRSSHHTVAQALCDVIVEQLSESNAPHSSEAVAT